MLKFHFTGIWQYNTYKSVYYIHTYPLVGNPTTLKSARAIESCREFFVKSYRNKINDATDHNTAWARKANVLLTFGQPAERQYDARCTKLKEASEKSLYIINSFEKEHKWPLTKLYPVECKEKKIPFVFFSGPRKWTTSPYLMSIWALCVRLGRHRWIPKELLTLNHEDLVEQLFRAAKSNGKNDAGQLWRTIREWDPFMTLYPDLFSDNTRKYHWKTKHLNGHNDRPEGIQMLINGTTGYKSLHKRYFELKEAKKLK